MTDSNRLERVQVLVDAIRLTVAALRMREMEATLWRASVEDLRPRAAVWWPTPEPRGWPATQLGTERGVMIPYIVPQMVPVGIGSPIIGGVGSPIVGGIGNPGLIHSGHGMGLQPIYRSQGMIPYGYGLLHSGPEIHGSIGYGIGHGPIGYMPVGYSPIGYAPIGAIPAGPYNQIPVGIPVGAPAGVVGGPALQPAWSPSIGTSV